MKNKSKNKKLGFSIGEVILSVFILGVTLTAIMTMYTTGIKELFEERDTVVASLLAQEGIELVRNIRDNDWVNGDSLDTTLTDTSPPSGCIIDAVSDSDCVSSATYDLGYNSGFYVHSGSATGFSRKIIIDDSVGNSGVGEEIFKITSVVTWDNESVAGLDKDNCAISSKCVFSEAELTEWGDSN